MKTQAAALPQTSAPAGLMAQAALNRPRRTVQGLLQAGDITQEAADAAERWCRNYVFGYFDYLEHTNPAPQGQSVRHDAVSWQMVRAQAMARITTVRDALGLCAHQRLRMMLVDDLSFRAMGEALFPAISSSSAQRKIAAQCALVLEQLAVLEITLHRAEQAKKASRRKNTGATKKVLQP